MSFEADELKVEWSHITEGANLGVGAFAQVLAIDLKGHADRKLALKKTDVNQVLPNQRASLLSSVRREVRALRRLKHECIITLYGVVNVPGRFMGLVMDRADRGSLRLVLDDVPSVVTSNPSVQMRLAADIASALAYLHSFSPPKLHHDLKSANVLIFEREAGMLRAKLSDFGLSKDLHGTSARATSTMNAMAGTRAYLAPEQFTSVITTASEVYSYAIILWELLHGDVPWSGRNDIHIMAAVVSATPPNNRPPVTAADGVLRQLMQACWEHD